MGPFEIWTTITTVAILSYGLHNTFVLEIREMKGVHWLVRKIFPYCTWVLIAVLIGLSLHTTGILVWR